MSQKNVEKYVEEEKFIRYNDKSKRAFDMVKQPTKEDKEKYSFSEKDWVQYLSATKNYFNKIYKAYMIEEKEYKSLKQRQEEAKDNNQEIPLTQEEMIKKFLEEKQVKKIQPAQKERELYEGQSRRFLNKGNERRAEEKVIKKEIKGVYDGLKMMYPDGSRIVEYEQVDALSGNVRSSKSKAGVKVYYRRTMIDPKTKEIVGNRTLWGNSIKKNIEEQNLVPIDQKIINKYIKAAKEKKNNPKGPKI